MSLKNAGILLMLLLSVALSGCKHSDKAGSREMICGSSSKTWHEVKETDSGGDKTRLSTDDKKAVMQFYSNGNFAVLSTNENANGTWTYDAAAKNLSLQFAGANVTKNFSVEDLTDKKMVLKAADGSLMTMEAE